jgi:hypothetical protein
MTCAQAKEKNRTITLSRQIKDWSKGIFPNLLPTPVASECRDSQLTPEQAKTLDKGGRVLRRMGTFGMLGDGKDSLQLNPQFVGEMMGFPPNWTELPFLNGETNPLKPTETP